MEDKWEETPRQNIYPRELQTPVFQNQQCNESGESSKRQLQNKSKSKSQKKQFWNDLKKRVNSRKKVNENLSDGKLILSKKNKAFGDSSTSSVQIENMTVPNLGELKSFTNETQTPKVKRKNYDKNIIENNESIFEDALSAIKPNPSDGLNYLNNKRIVVDLQNLNESSLLFPNSAFLIPDQKKNENESESEIDRLKKENEELKEKLSAQSQAANENIIHNLAEFEEKYKNSLSSLQNNMTEMHSKINNQQKNMQNQIFNRFNTTDMSILNETTFMKGKLKELDMLSKSQFIINAVNAASQTDIPLCNCHIQFQKEREQVNFILLFFIPIL